MYEVLVNKKSLKNMRKAPKSVKLLFNRLIKDLEQDGVVQSKWANYSKLGENKYHCHLNHSYVACWYSKNKSIKIEVYYAGSRENAPY